MRILHLAHRYYPVRGGAETYIQELSERFAADGDDVTVYTTNAESIEYLVSPRLGKSVSVPLTGMHNGVAIRRFPVVHFPLKKYLWYGISMLPSWKARCLFGPYQAFLPALIAEGFQKNNFDIVHATASPFSSVVYAGYMIARSNNIPFIYTPFVHLGTMDDPSIRKEHISPHLLSLMQSADAVVVQTNAEGEYLKSQGIMAERLHTVGVGINPEKLSGGDGGRFRSRYNISPGNIIIGHIARLGKNKGTLDLLEAFSILRETMNSVTLVIVGETSSEIDRVLAGKSSLKENVVHLQHIDDAGKNDFLDAMNIYAMPSRVESFGIVYLESWFYKKPVIGADIPAVRDVITDGVDGSLVQFGDVYRLAGVIKELMSHPEKAKLYGENGYRKTMTKHTWEKKYEMVNQLYHSLISEKGG